MDEAWRLQAACRGMDTPLFFSEADEAVAEAKAVCAGCAVWEECLAYAQRTKQTDGVWGGYDEEERRRLRRKPRGPRLGQWTGPVAEGRRIAEAEAKGYPMERCHRCGQLYAAHRLHNHLVTAHGEAHAEECPECHKQIRSSRIVGHMATHWGHASYDAQRKRLQRARARGEECPECGEMIHPNGVGHHMAAHRRAPDPAAQRKRAQRERERRQEEAS